MGLRQVAAMDSNIASNIDANTSNLPETSAAPGERRLYQIRDTLQNNETNHLRKRSIKKHCPVLDPAELRKRKVERAEEIFELHRQT